MYYCVSLQIRCESEPADLPKKATLPSIKEDTLSYLDEERASQSSQGKASREDSLVSGRAISRRSKIIQIWGGGLGLILDLRGSVKGGPSKLKSIVHFTMKNKTEEGGGACNNAHSVVM